MGDAAESLALAWSLYKALMLGTASEVEFGGKRYRQKDSESLLRQIETLQRMSSAESAGGSVSRFHVGMGRP